MAGIDNTAALRATILSLSQCCPKGAYPPDVPCPFMHLAGLSYASRKQMLSQMDEATLLMLFDLTFPCRCPADPRSPPPAKEKT